MSYNMPIYFQSVKTGEYNAITANHEPDTVTEVKKFASVTDTGVEMLKVLFGKVEQGSSTVRLQRPYKEPFERIRIGNKVYSVKHKKLNNRVFIVSELKQNGEIKG